MTTAIQNVKQSNNVINLCCCAANSDKPGALCFFILSSAAATSEVLIQSAGLSLTPMYGSVLAQHANSSHQQQRERRLAASISSVWQPSIRRHLEK